MFDNPDTQARFFYLAILLLAVAGSIFFHYRGRLSSGLQHAAIWVLIFAGATLAVGFWEPLMSQLRPGRAEVSGSGEVILRRAANGHFFADVEVNGTPVRFMVDTGASAVVLSKSDAERAGIDVSRLVFATPVSTANGVVRAADVRLDRVSLGGETDRNIPAMVNGGRSGGSLLGMDYLDRYRSIRIEGDRLILQR